MNVLHALSVALTPLGIFWTLTILTLSVTLHELAHYLAARRQGVEVSAFSVGMGPVLLRKRWRGTEWRISALPLGGYVTIDGMNAHEDGTPPTTGYAALRPWQRIFILGAAPLTNIALAFMLLTGLLSVQGQQSPVANRILISQVSPHSKAEQLGLKAGDVVVALDGQPLPEQFSEPGESGRGSVQKPGWQKLSSSLKVKGTHTLGLVRGAQHLNITFDWAAAPGAKLGVAYGPDIRVTPLSVPQAAALSGRTILQSVPQTITAFKNVLLRLLSFNFQPDNGVVGPVGTAQAVSQAAKLGLVALLGVAIAINVGLGLMNLFPIPGLDGGHIVLELLGVLRGKPLSFERYQQLTMLGFILLMLLSAFVMVRDVARFF